VNVLGISCHYHDAAAALIQDGLLIAAAEEERFTRRKHDSGFPHQAIAFCLREAGLDRRDVDYVVFYEKPLLKFERILLASLGTFPRGWSVFRESMISWFNEKLWVKSEMMKAFDVPADRVLFVEHHLSHAASAFFCSPFDRAAVLTIDGVGEWASATVGRASAAWPGQAEPADNRIEMLEELRFPHSLGLLYSAFTAFLGFEVNEGEYKVMGMAPYGQPRYLDDVLKTVCVADDGSLRLDMDYFTFHTSTRDALSRRFLELFGEPRKPDQEFFTAATNPEADSRRAAENQRYADVAASIQQVTEDVVLKMARYAHERTGLKHLCLAGGVALNSVANGRLLRESPFEALYIQPAAGDPGGALGAALYAYHVLLGQPRKQVLEHAYWGACSDEDTVRTTLDDLGATYEWLEDEDRLAERVAGALAAGQVVGLHQGRFEWGPRALGNRSILADPRRAEMKDLVNQKIKFREPFRPFAPVVPECRAAEYFDIADPETIYPARFMLLVSQVRPDKRESIPAVTHVDGSGRLQTLRREWNPRYYDILRTFEAATGVPVLLNTSFNLRGEPIVNTPAEAYRTFRTGEIDLLVVGNALVKRTP
jgi:carbamoyltransferase